MKVTFNIDCSPEEARAFLGLPDIAPMQQALLADLENRLRANIEAMSPEAMIRTWMPAGLQNVEQAQKLFWSQMQQTLSGIATTASGAMNAFTERADKKE
jgi:hypothetical protein